jgi:diguanylate cyclase (GGDEF)-like protein
VGLPVSLYRWSEIGFQPIFIHHIVLSLIVFAAALCKKTVKALHLIIMVVIITLGYMFTHNIIQYQVDPSIYAYMPSARAKRNNSLVAMLFIDVNKFKLINDVHGHAVGDQTLVDIATNLKAQLREYDYAIRVGGDEFIILLNDVTSSEQVLEITDRLVQQLEIKSALTPFITPEISMGIAIYPKDGSTFTELKQKADSAMYQAKEDELLKICINNKKV